MRKLPKALVYLVPLFLLISIVYGATIQGNVYDSDLNPLDKAIIEITPLDSNNTPRDLVVVRAGYFLADVEEGRYNLKATYTRQGIVRKYAEQNISVGNEGLRNLDIIMQNLNVSEEEILAEQTQNQPFDFKFAAIFGLFVLVIVILTAAIVLIYRTYSRFRGTSPNKEEVAKTQNEQVIEKEKQEAEMFYSAERVLEIIKKHGGRTTQKDIRKELPLSEGKISLMITELEHQGKIEKIKKGRGNIVILKKPEEQKKEELT